jgi:hypothetical protein
LAPRSWPAGAPGLGYGALAPPLEPTLPEFFSEVFSDDAFSLEAFSDSPPADVPPAAPLSEDPEPLSEELSPLDSLPPVVLDLDSSPVVELVDVLAAVVEVEVVSVASFSAEVSFGGVISGVLLGVTSETLLPPQELSPRPKSNMRALAPSAIRRER